MSLIGKIQSLFLDREKTQPIFPITKVKAVSDDDGKGLNVLLDEMNNRVDEIAPNGVVPISHGGTGASYSAGARKSLRLPFTTPLYATTNFVGFVIAGDSSHARKIPVTVKVAHQSGYMCEIMFVINTLTGAPVGTNFTRWGNIGVTSFIYTTEGNTTTYSIKFNKSGMYAMGLLSFCNYFATGSGHSGEQVMNLDAYQYLHDITEGTTLTEATIV